MTTESHNPRRGTRDNGLRAAGYSAIADLDPRVADALLTTLREAGIAAYAQPTPGDVGGYMETRLPSTPTDRLWVDGAMVEPAREILQREKDAHQPERVEEQELDFEAAWQQVLQSLQATASDPTDPASYPPTYDAGSPDDDDDRVFDNDDEHFEPPPPPPLPRLRSVTFAALACIALGLVVLAMNLDGGSFTLIAVAAILFGVGSLVWNMRKGPPNDSGWDDGAVV